MDIKQKILNKLPNEIYLKNLQTFDEKCSGSNHMTIIQNIFSG